MKISAIDQQKGCCKHIHRFFPQRIFDESTLLPAPPEKTEGNRNQRWKTESNGELFSGHPGVFTVLNRFCPFSSVLPSQTFASVLFHTALPLTKKNTDTSALATASTSLSRQAQLHTFTHLRCSSHHPGSAGNALQPEFWEYWEY